MKLALVAVALAAHVAHADPHEDRHRTRRALALAAAAGVYATWETAAKGSLAPDACRWCVPSGFDAGAREALVWRDPALAATLSDVVSKVAAPLAAAGLVLAVSDHRVDDLTSVAEAAMYSQLAVQVFKYSFGRERPYAHYMTGVYAPSSDDHLSFISGHSALAFSIATAVGMIAHRNHSRYEPAVWITGMAIATATAYLRIAADKHYATDVLGGAALGIAGGLVIPGGLSGEF